MNPHQLELFYFVARHGGISRAVRHIPYGIQQPAVSGQILALEKHLGTRLFQRTPFALTPAGEKLFAHVAPFFSALPDLEKQLRQDDAPLLRIAASDLVLRFHLPIVLARLREKHPRLRVTLRAGYQNDFESWLEDGSIDLAIAPLDHRPPPRIQHQRLIEIPLVLLVPQTHPARQASDFWAQSPLGDPLISLPETESVVKKFRAGLRGLKVDWPVGLEASSLELISSYVANGYGIGLSVALPEITTRPGYRVLPLPHFPPLEIGLLWSGAPSPLVAAFQIEAQRLISEKWRPAPTATAPRRPSRRRGV